MSNAFTDWIKQNLPKNSEWSDGSGKKCSYVYEEKYSKKKHPCNHPTYHGQDTCVFHSPDVEAKTDDFRKAWKHYMKHCEKSKSVEFYDFRGFVFPKIELRGIKFLKPADFSSSTFSGSAYFSSSTFSGDADFSSSTFSGSAYFRNSTFSRSADFSSSTFSRSADFRNSNFSGDASFRNSTFSVDASFINSTFSGDASFRNSTFEGPTHFNECDFQKQSDFSRAHFHEPLSMEQAHLTFLTRKKAQVKGINFRGAVIDEANLWGIERLEGYDFSHSFLLSLSLAGREIIDCDFTGALIDAVRTRDWKPDDATLRKSKYIYTDYVTEMVVDSETWKERLQYTALEESRVPASGNFGEGEHEHFTIREYLKERYRWSRGLSLPTVIRTAVLNYIQFFSDFIRITEGLDVQIVSKPEGSKIRVEFQADSREDKALVEERFQTYLLQTQLENPEQLNIHFSEKAQSSNVEKQILIIDLKSQIRSLKDKVDSTQLLLTSEKEKVAILQNSKMEFQKFVQQWTINPNQLLEPVPAKSVLESPQSQPDLASKRQSFAVAKGDIRGFSDFMEKGHGASITKAFEEIVDHHSRALKKAEVKEGDSLCLVAGTADELWIAAKRIQEDLARAEGRPQLRLALDFGEVEFEDQEGFVIRGGAPLRTSARLEPLVVPGKTWCTERFKVMLSEAHQAELHPITDTPGKLEASNEQGQYNLAKSGESPLWEKLYSNLLD